MKKYQIFRAMTAVALILAISISAGAQTKMPAQKTQELQKIQKDLQVQQANVDKDTLVSNIMNLSNVTVTTFAGSGQRGFANGKGTSAMFNRPKGVAVDAKGNVYVTEGEVFDSDDDRSHYIRKITPDAVVSSLAGKGPHGFADGAAATAQFYSPCGVAVDAKGVAAYIADRLNYRIRKITLSSTVTVSTVAGSNYGFQDGLSQQALFYGPGGIAVDSKGNIYVADESNTIRKITPNGNVSTLVNNPKFSKQILKQMLKEPKGIAVDDKGNLYVADAGSHSILKVTSAGKVTTLAGTGSSGFADGAAASAKFNSPYGVAVDASGNVYVADTGNHRIRKITTAGQVTTVAGTGSPGFVNGFGSKAQFNNPFSVAIDVSGNIYVGDSENNCIRKIVESK